MRKIEEKKNPLITIVTIGVVAALTGVVVASGYAEIQIPPVLPSVVIMTVSNNNTVVWQVGET